MLIQLNQEIMSKLTKTELSIIQFINQNEDNLSNLSIVDIAMDTYSSPSSVSRAIRKCGINGFNELRYKTSIQSKKNDVKNVADIFNKSLIEAQNVIENISIGTVLNVLNVIKKAKRIYVLARGLSEYVGKEFSFKLQLLGFDSIFLDDPNIMQIITQGLDNKDCVFVFSLNGQTKELIESCKNARSCGATIITACSSEKTELMCLSDYYLQGYNQKNRSIVTYEVGSRISLSIIARIIIDYLATY